MRILVVNDRLRPSGGSEHSLRVQVHGLQQRGHEVLIAAPADEIEAGRKTSPFADCRLVAIPAGPGLRSARTGAAAIHAAAEQFQADLLDVQNLGGFLGPRGTLTLCSAWPMVHTCRDVRPSCPRETRALPQGGLCHDRLGLRCLRRGCLGAEQHARGPRALLEYGLRFRALQKAGLVLVESTAMSSLFLELGLPDRQLRILPMCVTAPARIRQSPSAAPPDILGVGLLDNPTKGLHHLLRAFASLRHGRTRLLLTGKPGRAWKEARSLLRSMEASERVFPLGWVPDQELMELRQSVRVLAFPSRFFESFGLAGAEAAAAARPVVAVDCGGARDWVEDGISGALVDREQPQAMADALDRYLADPLLADRHGLAGRDLVTTRFTRTANLDATLQAYAEALAR